MKTIGVAKFKAQCLALFDRLDPEGIVITRHGRPIARVVPYPPSPADRIGALRDKIRIRGDVMSTGAAWDASAES